jgi:hypothetical protein
MFDQALSQESECYFVLPSHGSSRKNTHAGTAHHAAKQNAPIHREHPPATGLGQFNPEIYFMPNAHRKM